jgi:prevent-host-death family protein
LRYDTYVTTVIPQRELRNNNADILNRVQAGETFVVTRNGVAVADLVPHVDRAGPPPFPKTNDLLARRRTLPGHALDRDSWLRDIREAPVDDDPFDSRA